MERKPTFLVEDCNANAYDHDSIGYAPFAAALYTNNRFGTEWFIYLGASLCGISAGVFWMAEAAIAIAYPEVSDLNH